ncbi:hypothetical protein pb186bvf_018265 [Paramecium bursaria]
MVFKNQFKLYMNENNIIKLFIIQKNLSYFYLFK